MASYMEELDRMSNFEEFEAGEVVFAAGQRGELIFVVLEGEVVLERDGEVFERVGRGGLLGEETLSRVRHSWTARAATDARLAPLGRRRYEQVLEQYAELGERAAASRRARARRRVLRFPVTAAGAAAFTVLALASAAGALDDGDLDTSFGSDGQYVFAPNLDGAYRLVADLAVSHDGKILTFGSTGTFPDTDLQYCRVAANGNGRICADLAPDLGGTNRDEPAAIAVAPDGKRVLVGSSIAAAYPSGTHWIGVVHRLTVADALDSSFSGDGRALIVGSGDIVLKAAAVQSDQKIVVVGALDTVSDGSVSSGDVFVARLTASGTADSMFASNGRAVVPLDLGGSHADTATAVAIDDDGRILVAGFATKPVGTDVFVCRLSAAGELDASYASSGCAIFGIDLVAGGSDYATQLAIDRFGRAVVAGHARLDASHARVFVARLLPNGLADGTFASAGLFKSSIAGHEDILGVSGLALLPPPADLILLTGSYFSGPYDEDPYVLALRPDGTLASEFGAAGVATWSSPDGEEPSNYGMGIALQGGKPVVAGYFPGSDRIWTARLWSHQIFGDDFEGGHVGAWSTPSP